MEVKPLTESTRVSLTNSKEGTFQIILEPPGLIEDTIVSQGAWEPYLAQILSRFIRYNSVFLDIGTNIGYHSLYIASLYPSVTCIGFEPHPEIYQQLNASIHANGFTNMVVYNKAVGNTAGSIDFYMQNKTCYNRGLSSIHFDQAIGVDYQKIKIGIVALDEFLSEETKCNVSVLKIDTQGFEYEVFKGALNLIQQSRPIIAFELHCHSNYQLGDILRLIPDYVVYKLQPFTGEVHKLEEVDPNNYLHDYLCVPCEIVNQ